MLVERARVALVHRASSSVTGRRLRLSPLRLALRSSAAHCWLGLCARCCSACSCHSSRSFANMLTCARILRTHAPARLASAVTQARGGAARSVRFVQRLQTSTSVGSSKLASSRSSHNVTRAFSSTSSSQASAAPSSSADDSASESNPLLASPDALPRFSAITAAHIREGCPRLCAELEAAFRAHEAALDAAMKDGSSSSAARLSWEGVVEPLERILDRFGFVMGTVSHLCSVRDSAELRAAAQEIEPQRVALSLAFAQSTVLFRALQSLQSNPNPAQPLSKAQAKILGDMVLEATLSGVGLASDPQAQREFNALSQRLAVLGQRFGHNVLDATKRFGLTITEAQVMEGVPASAKSLYAQAARESSPEMGWATAEAGPWRVGLSGPSVVPFLTYCASRPHRELVHSAYISRASRESDGIGTDNAPVVAEMLVLKKRLASMLGYASYASMGLATKLVKTPDQVDAFLEDLRGVAYPLAQADLAALRDFALKDGFAPHLELAAHDVAFYAQRLMASSFKLDPEQLRPYFPFPRVLQGMFQLLEEIFEVAVVERPGGQVGPAKLLDTWHPDVKYFDVFKTNRATGQREIIAGFFADAYSRPAEKRGGAWMGECVGRALVRVPAAGGGAASSTLRLPVAFLICNQPAGVDGKPSLMSFEEVLTLFHEMGHVTQHLFTTVDHSFAAGIRSVQVRSDHAHAHARTHARARSLALRRTLGSAAFSWAPRLRASALRAMITRRIDDGTSNSNVHSLAIDPLDRADISISSFVGCVCDLLSSALLCCCCVSVGRGGVGVTVPGEFLLRPPNAGWVVLACGHRGEVARRPVRRDVRRAQLPGGLGPPPTSAVLRTRHGPP